MAPTTWEWSDQDDGFVVHVSLPKLQRWRNRWYIAIGQRSGVDGPFDDDEGENEAGVPVVLLGPLDEEGFGERRRTKRPSKAQITALERLAGDEVALDEAIAQYLLQAITSPSRGINFPGPTDFDDPEQQRRVAHLLTPAGVRELFRLQRIHVLDRKKKGLAYLHFNFDSELDPEHGFVVVVHGTAPVGIGQLGEADLGLPLGESDALAAAAQQAAKNARQAIAAALIDARNGPGIHALSSAAAQLPAGRSLRISIRIKTPPFRFHEAFTVGEAGTCSYELSVQVGRSLTVVNATDSPAQDYLYPGPWPLTLFAPIVQWPYLTPAWDTVQALEVDDAKSLRLGRWVGNARPELLDAAVSAWRQGLDAQEAAARNVVLRQDPPPPFA